VIEARQGYYFDEAIAEPTVHYITAPGKQYATHGYSPHKPDYTCLFIAAGNGVLRRGDLGALEMVDIAPTMANLLGLPFSRRDGRPIAGLG
jgi:predicted AlkP superfamily pyrophosphatase or phosphodiesterase